MRPVASYAGNPLALKIMAQAISELFGGDLDRFLEEGELVFNGIRPVLRQQVGRLTPLEHLLLIWLVVLREWTPLDTLMQVLLPRVLRARVLARAVRISPDGKTVSSCGEDGVIQFWDMQSHQHLATLRAERPYERLDISATLGLTKAQQAALRVLGVISLWFGRGELRVS